MQRKILATAAAITCSLVCVASLHGAGQDRQAPPSTPTARGPAADTQVSGAAAPQAAGSVQVPHKAVLGKYCVTCHNDKRKTAGVTFESLDADNLSANGEVWEKTLAKLSARAMPPAGSPRPDEDAYRGMVTWLQTSLDKAAAASPRAGRPVAHRLNRTQYANAVRDVLGVTIDPQSWLPADDSGYGFDNVGDVLSVSPALLQRYLFAAQKISRLAVGDPAPKMTVDTYRVSFDVQQNERMDEDAPFGSRGGLAVNHYFPADGEYVIKLKLHRFAGQGGLMGLQNRERIDVRVDGRQVGMIEVGGECVNSKELRCITPPGIQVNSDYEMTADDKLEVRFQAASGPRRVTATFLRRESAEPESLGPLPTVLAPDYGSMALSQMDVRGPFNPTGVGSTPSRQRVFSCYPRSAGEEDGCATAILTTLARRAYRRQVSDEDVKRLMTFYRKGRQQGDFDNGIRWGLERLLVSPNFLLRVEPDPPGVTAGQAYRVGDVTLASRLSFFLWNSIPDDTLLDLAARGRLHDPLVLQQQVRRMMADPRSNQLIDNFAAQWLYLRDLRKIQPDLAEFPAFSENIRNDSWQETSLFLQSQMRDNRPLAELLTANYTFLNQRMAQFYGIPNVYGNHFRRVALTDGRRGGLLGQASVLTVTSYANRTSPVQRGKYVMANILGQQPPTPPPNVPPLQASGEGGAAPTSVRERMEMHRKNPVCASCHARIDPLGFALEHFDGIGRWRDTESGKAIDSSGQFPDGTKFTGPDDFRIALTKYTPQFVEGFTRKLLTYSLGRGAEYFDMPAIRGIMRTSAPDYRWSALILGIVNSAPFQMKQAADAEPLQASNATGRQD